MAMSSLLTIAGHDPMAHVSLVCAALVVFLAAVFVLAFVDVPRILKSSETVNAYARFFYACMLKPHTGDGSGSQQDALESFYKAQAAVYDATRSRLLKGREDMLGLVAAQLKHRLKENKGTRKPIWVDIGGGTGWNIEKMSAYLDVDDFFHAVYLVDFSPSLCEIARARFARLGWTNVKVICDDARRFRLEDYEEVEGGNMTPTLSARDQVIYEYNDKPSKIGADLLTMSYALSMIPEYYPVIDSLSTLLSPAGLIGVCDFYVQNRVDCQSRNYTGGMIDRHCTWMSRVFWRTWFEIDRVNLDPARRDYLEYRFGTVLSINARNHMFGVRIPYYVWVGCSKAGSSTETHLAELDAAATESPFLSALDLQAKTAVTRAGYFETRSKAYESAIVNLASRLPLPASWYQNHHWRIYYDSHQQKHRQFNDEYIYAFTWEDSRMDSRLLKVQADDVILSITSAGDNILSFALAGPKRIHAVDLNPAQNHLLELKVAAFQSLEYADVWKLFGEGKHENFRAILVEKLSPHLSSLAFQFWLSNADTFTSRGLYNTGGSRHALQLVRWIFALIGLSGEIKRLCAAPTLAEQREIWEKSIRRVLLSKTLSWAVIGNEKWLWKALGVPPEQRNLIEEDYQRQDDTVKDSAESSVRRGGKAIWEYVVNTLDPVVGETLLNDDNHYYLLCLQGKYSRRCHPEYCSPRAHIKLSTPTSFDGLRIHTDAIEEVIARMSPGTLTIAVVMDSMDWFKPDGEDAPKQIKALNRVMKSKGRVLVRSAGLMPWYIRTFEECGFLAKRVAARVPGTCTDRVNMYASTWIMTKVKTIDEQEESEHRRRTGPMEMLNI
ncbi:hypothetical protein K402DRAFT_354389 [Aulographum hederae CBS 113979]|uniref:Betaine lipid synthase n=1 Tax=Aulographum hederae CBS 113979 TaxID=1176131 RepID=A0A6G1H1P8_9PEZI|nr:hypothetical protein K402DRAFT_354389 [Aulographum hederae CBS 113979]